MEISTTVSPQYHALLQQVVDELKRHQEVAITRGDLLEEGQWMSALFVLGQVSARLELALDPLAACDVADPALDSISRILQCLGHLYDACEEHGALRECGMLLATQYIVNPL